MQAQRKEEHPPEVDAYGHRTPSNATTSAWSLPQKNRYTITDIYALPDGVRAELVDGRIYYMAPPGRTHQLLIVELSTAIMNYIKSKNGNCEVDLAPFAVFLSDDESTYVEPDISVVCDRSKLSDNGCHGAPDWVIEVVSPGSRRMDYHIKLFLYQKAGLREYWIVDYPQRRIIVHNFEEEDTSIYSFDNSVKVGIYEDLTIDFSDIVESMNP